MCIRLLRYLKNWRLEDWIKEGQQISDSRCSRRRRSNEQGNSGIIETNSETILVV